MNKYDIIAENANRQLLGTQETANFSFFPDHGLFFPWGKPVFKLHNNPLREIVLVDDSEQEHLLFEQVFEQSGLVNPVGAF